MKALQIGRTRLWVRDYACSQDDRYIPRAEPRLWLYVDLTDRCDAACPFCVHAGDPGAAASMSPRSPALARIRPHMSVISLTGGEPMLDVPLLEEVIAASRSALSPEVGVDMVTNGTNLNRLPGLRGLECLTTVHVSRHAVHDEQNRWLMDWREAPSLAEM